MAQVSSLYLYRSGLETLEYCHYKIFREVGGRTPEKIFRFQTVEYWDYFFLQNFGIRAHKIGIIGTTKFESHNTEKFLI